VLKTYIGERNEPSYKQEKRALMALQNHPSKHIVTFYGSFQQEDRRSLILEYVNGGNLLDFMRNNQPPTAMTDILDFWTSLVNVLQGVFRIHQMTDHAENAADYRIVHEDLKPDNVLLETQDGQSKYVFRLKIADFGCSDVLSLNRDRVDTRAFDHHGHPTYSAPEATHHQRWMASGDNRISSAADIWSMGCILSEAAAWLVHGDTGLQTYASERHAEHSRSRTFEGSNYVGCFHNGFEALVTVFETHEWIFRHRKPYDSVTPEILHIVTTLMLVGDPQKRAEAKSLTERFHRILESHGRIAIPSASDDRVGDDSTSYPTPLTSDNLDLAERLGALQVVTSDPPSSAPLIASNPLGSPTSLLNSPPRPTSTDPTMTRSQSKRKRFKESISSFLSISPAGPSTLKSPSPTSTTRTGTPLDDYLSMQEVLKYREDKKNTRVVAPRVHELITKLKTNLDCRDHIFFIEDSPTMFQHIQAVERAFVVLSYLAKQIDKDELELVFSSSPSTVHRNTRTTPLIEKLEQHQFKQAQGMMESQLGEFIQNNIVRRLSYPAQGKLTGWHPKKPLSIFIFTDGCWGQDLPEAAGVENPVRNLMNVMQRLGLNRTQVMIQLIRFGDDLDGKRYLKTLDDLGQPLKM
jgi:serine/threonine protein kinase